MNLNIRDYLEIDYEATKCNISNLIEGSEYSNETIAGILFTQKRNVDNWVRGNSMPGLEDLVALSRILGVSIDQIIVKKYQIKEIELGEEESKKQIKELYEKNINCREEYNEIQKIQESVLLDAQCETICPVRNLIDFLIILPYFPDILLNDLFSRTEYMEAKDWKYIRKQITKIWDQLPKKEKEECKKDFL